VYPANSTAPAPCTPARCARQFVHPSGPDAADGGFGSGSGDVGSADTPRPGSGESDGVSSDVGSAGTGWLLNS
jgi:hypothetical protein